MEKVMTKLKILLMISLMSIVFVADVYAQTEVEALIEKASQAREKASQLGYEWTATKGLIDSAIEANSQGKTVLAKTLASRALKQAENGIKQAEYSDKHWQDAIPK
jgi:hypothetical protein